MNPSQIAIFETNAQLDAIQIHQVNLQDNGTRHQILAKQLKEACRVGALSPNDFQFLFFDHGLEHKKMLMQTKGSDLKDQKARQPRQKLKLFKSGRVNLQDNRTRHRILAKRREKSGTQPERTKIYIVWSRSRTREMLATNKGNRPEVEIKYCEENWIPLKDEEGWSAVAMQAYVVCFCQLSWFRPIWRPIPCSSYLWAGTKMGI